MIGRTPQIVIVYKAYYCIKMVLSCTLQQKTAHWHYIFVNPLAPEIFEFYGCVFPPTSHFYGYFIRENEVWNQKHMAVSLSLQTNLRITVNPTNTVIHLPNR